MKLIGKKGIILGIFSVALMAIALFITTYAWFSNTWLAKNSISFTTGNYLTPNYHAWMFDALEEESGESSNRDEGQWVDATQTISESTVLKKVELNSNNSITEYLTFKSLHLGTIDNLLRLGNDNFFYIRFDVTDYIKMGKLVKVSYSISNNNIKIYNSEGTQLTIVSEHSDTPNTITGNYEDLITIDCAVSTYLFSNPRSSVTISGESRSIDYLFTDGNTGNYVSLENGDDPVLVSSTEQSSAYYLYIRIVPDLDKCVEATEVLSVYMPCEITFDVDLDIEFMIFE